MPGLENVVMSSIKFVKYAPPVDSRIGWDEHGVPRIVGTRVHLHYVLYQYKQGESPEQIIGHYPTLKLADVYAVIAYYLQNKEEMEEFYRKAEEEEEQSYAEMVANNPEPLSERIRARYEAQQKAKQRAS